MANKTVTLMDTANGNELYPATLTSQIFDNNNQALDTTLTQINSNIKNINSNITALQNAINALGIKYKDLGPGGNCRQRYLICVGGMGIWAGYTNDWNDASAIKISYGVTFASSPYPTATFTGGGAAQYYDGKWIRNITSTDFDMWNACNSGTGAFIIAMGPIDASTIN